MKRTITTDDVTIVTYSNTKCLDIWPMYLGQLTKHAPMFSNMKSCMFVNGPEPIKDTPIFSKHSFCYYDEAQPYWQQWTTCLENVQTDYVIYMQEDFILNGDVDRTAIESYANFLEDSDYSFVRLIRANFDMTLRPLKGDLYDVNTSNEDIFHMQATLWKKKDIKDLYIAARSEKWLEGPHWRAAARAMGIKGAYCYRGEKQRGRYHFDSSVFPYICTAVNRGLWNMNEYGNELGPLLREYGIDPTIRGVRQDYNYVNRNR